MSRTFDTSPVLVECLAHPSLLETYSGQHSIFHDAKIKLNIFHERDSSLGIVV